MVHIYGHQNIGKPESKLNPLASLNVLIDALSEQIMTSFILLSATRNTIVVGFSDTYILSSIYIRGVPVHSNLAQSIAYKISKLRILQYWDNKNLTHMSYWEGIELTSFKQAPDNTTVHMVNFITKGMSNTFSTITILQ